MFRSSFFYWSNEQREGEVNPLNSLKSFCLHFIPLNRYYRERLLFVYLFKNYVSLWVQDLPHKKRGRQMVSSRSHRIWYAVGGRVKLTLIKPYCRPDPANQPPSNPKQKIQFKPDCWIFTTSRLHTSLIYNHVIISDWYG